MGSRHSYLFFLFYLSLFDFTFLLLVQKQTQIFLHTWFFYSIPKSDSSSIKYVSCSLLCFKLLFCSSEMCFSLCSCFFSHLDFQLWFVINFTLALDCFICSLLNQTVLLCCLECIPLFSFSQELFFALFLTQLLCCFILFHHSSVSVIQQFSSLHEFVEINFEFLYFNHDEHSMGHFILQLRIFLSNLIEITISFFTYLPIIEIIFSVIL